MSKFNKGHHRFMSKRVFISCKAADAISLSSLRVHQKAQNQHLPIGYELDIFYSFIFLCRCKQEENSSLSRLVALLRTYFGEVKQAEETVSLWQQERYHLETRISVSTQCRGGLNMIL